MNKQEYAILVKRESPPTQSKKTLLGAFLIGGTICALGQAFKLCYLACGLAENTAALLVPVTLIVLTALLTGLGFFSRIARVGGAGALVPITGFANAVVSPAIEYKSEGFVTGVGVNLFKIAGPVIAYGTAAGFVYGVILWIIRLVGNQYGITIG